MIFGEKVVKKHEKIRKKVEKKRGQKTPFFKKFKKGDFALVLLSKGV